MPHAHELITRRQAARAGTHYKYLLARFFRRLFKLPAFCKRQVTKESLNGMNAHGTVGKRSITHVLARVVTDSTVN